MSDFKNKNYFQELVDKISKKKLEDVSKEENISPLMKKVQENKLAESRIKNPDVMKVQTGSSWKENLSKKLSKSDLPEKVLDSGKLKKEFKLMEKLAKKGLINKGIKGIAAGVPMLGSLVGLGTALATGDANAAVPILGDVESTGPEKVSLDEKFESGEELTPEEKQELLRQYYKK